jgi:predicted RNase H-related nuclease YkuK (DUF458 family)
MVFKKLQSGEEIQIVSYINEYMETNTDAEILIGCDSQNSRSKTIYAIVVALYRPGKGGHVLYRKWSTERERVRSIRLLQEVWFAIETAEYLKENGVKKPKWIDVDLNPDPRYKSNEVFRQAVGMVEGMGYNVRYKSLGPIATYCADHLVKNN